MQLLKGREENNTCTLQSQNKAQKVAVVIYACEKALTAILQYFDLL